MPDGSGSRGLAAVNGIGETVASSVRAYFQDEAQVQVLRALEQAGLAMAYRPKAGQEALGSALEGLKILASGKLENFSREEIVRVVEAHGGSYVKSVSKSLDFIIAGEDMGPSKREKAEKLGVKLITEAEFMALIEKSNT
ncbi:DNA ligase [Nitritalea halalkaliphila LW7]|uniref:DNA ligase n=1 Tax=Nitritalea halalkaliphila LW7 TaxID=1189621 RepID=I5C967_9BACT|nr:BRCT domain-containing protein [Nitritalea halalkaliphila]EIM78369.1 DNA ligase [Nitritalea halalkaliphila LW7]